jgi:phosphoribosylaminoimidazole carboxylase
MMALEAPRLNIDMKFLDGSGGACPAAQVVGVAAAAAASDYDNARIVEGGLYDAEKLRELSKGCDVVTMEIEHVGVEGLAQLENEGVNVQPSSRVIRIIQDKFAQKVCERLCAMMIDLLSLSLYPEFHVINNFFNAAIFLFQCV